MHRSSHSSHSHSSVHWFFRSALIVLVILTMAVDVPSPSVAVAATVPSLEIKAPQRVQVGQPITLTFFLRDAQDIAGYEASLLFDTSAAHFNELRQRQNDLRKFKRDVGPLGAALMPTGISFGLYSCPTEDCVQRKGAKNRKGGNGRVRLATVAIVGDKPGQLELRLANTRFVDANGNDFAVTVPDQIIRVTVEQNTPVLTAPAAPWQLAAPSTSTARPPELTGDGKVTHADVMNVLLEWTLAREAGSPCTLRNPANDTNRDGCIDVADLQWLASNYTTTAQATQQSGNTRSESSLLQDSDSSAQELAAPQAVTQQSVGTFVVNSTADDIDANYGDGVCATTGGACTLRAAIEEANRMPGANTVAFDIPGSGVQTIQINSLLPIINDESGALTIDGYTQPGASANNEPLISNAQIRIQLMGTGESNTYAAMFITSAYNTIRGLSFHKFWRSIWISGSGAHHNKVIGNLIGTNVAATYRSPSWVSSANGGVLLDQGATYNEVGTTNLADRNVVSGNTASGVYLTKENTNYNYVRNNLIGLGPLGNKKVPNILEGVDLNYSAAYNVVGGTGAYEHNVLSGNDKMGVEMSHGLGVVYNTIIGNLVGTDVTGTQVTSFSGNGQCGIHAEDGVGNNFVISNVIGGNGRNTNVGNKPSGGICVNGFYTRNNTLSNNLIGIAPNGNSIPNFNFGIEVRFNAYGTQIGPGNVVANNPAGVLIREGNNDNNKITQNSIYNNIGIGLDLQATESININDLTDGDTGANQQQNFPALSSASLSEVSGVACPACTVEVFIADTKSNVFGEGKTYLGSAVPDANGRFSVNVVGSGLELGDFITASATDAFSNTSEFGLSVPVFDGPMLAGTVLVADSFGRSLTDNWGSAQSGGPYTFSGSAADFDINGSVATMTTATGGNTRVAHLLSIAPRDIEATARVAVNKVATGGEHFAYVILRRISATAEYRARLRFATNGTVWAQMSRVNGSESAVGSEVQVPGLSYTPGSFLRIRTQATNMNPTRLRLKVWVDGEAEPNSWLLDTTDATAVLQGAGTVGLRTYVASSGNVPLVFSWDDLSVTALDSPPPPPPTNTPTSVPTNTPTSVPTNTPTSVPTNTPTSVPTNTPTSVPTGEPIPTNTPTPISGGTTTFALDTFSRTVADNWDSATTGGAYTFTGTTANFDVNGSAGTVVLAAGNTRAATLNTVSAQDVESVVTFQTNKTAVGSNQFFYVVVRRIDSSNEYRAKVRFGTGGQVYIQFNRVIGGTETAIGSEIAVSSLSHQADTPMSVRVQATGVSPTTLRMRIWATGQVEPTSWQYSSANSDAALQAPGSVGLRFYVGSAATNSPVLFSVDEWAVTSPITP